MKQSGLWEGLIRPRSKGWQGWGTGRPMGWEGGQAERASLARGEGDGESLSLGPGLWSQLPLAGLASIHAEDSGPVAWSTLNTQPEAHRHFPSF